MKDKFNLLLALGVVFSIACYVYFRHNDPKNSYAVFIFAAVATAAVLLGRLFRRVH